MAGTAHADRERLVMEDLESSFPEFAGESLRWIRSL
jgi:hypothetical protein